MHRKPKLHKDQENENTEGIFGGRMMEFVWSEVLIETFQLQLLKI